MISDNFKKELSIILDDNNIKYDEPMKNHTSFKVGGPAEVFAVPGSIMQLVNAIKLCSQSGVSFFIMGNGSNLIVRDGGYKGVIISLTSLNEIRVEEHTVIAQAGALLSNLAKEALKNSLKGLEFASGIPGTVGGAVTMNAGAYGPEIKDVIEYAIVSDMNGNIMKISREGLELSYRNSIIQKENYIVLEAAFRLETGIYDEIKNMMDDLNRRRVDKQPLNYPSAGSTFKRPAGGFAGKFIEDSGLKGIRIGGAAVSEKHAGFVINYDNATAGDVLAVINKVREVVREKFNVELEPEVKIIGEDF